MKFSYKLIGRGEAFIKHGNANKNCCLNDTLYIRKNYLNENIDEKTKKRIINKYKLLFYNHCFETSQFVKDINNNYEKSKEKDHFIYYLVLYIKQFYQDLEILKNVKDIKSFKSIFNEYNEKTDYLIYNFLKNKDFKQTEEEINLLNNIHKFYSIIEDFMIRFYNYSIIGVSDQKHIITSCNNCDKKFIDYLMEGYSLFRLQKIGLVNIDSKMQYIFFPVLPTKDVGFPIDEYIEISGDNDKIESKKLVKISKW